MGLWAAALASLIGGFAKKQNAPQNIPYTPVDTGQQQQGAIASNTAAQPGLEDLLSQSNKFQQGQANSMMEQALPGYGKLAGNLTAQATDEAANPYAVPADVNANISRLAAERGVNVGTRGQTQGFSALRDLGVNALNYGQQRLQSAASILSTVTGTAPRVSPMSPMSFYVTPGQNADEARYTNTRDQSTKQAGANAGAAATSWNRSAGWDGLLSSIMFGAGTQDPKLAAAIYRKA